VQKVREAAARTENANKLHQLSLAVHNYHDVNKVLPPYYLYAYSYYGTITNGVTGSWPFALLPYVEQDNVFNATLGPLIYSNKSSYSYSYTINGTSYNYSYGGNSKPTNLGGSANQAGRASGKIGVFYAKTDPTADTIDSPASFQANMDVF